MSTGFTPDTRRAAGAHPDHPAPHPDPGHTTLTHTTLRNATPPYDDMEVARALYRPDSGGYRRIGAGAAAVAVVAGSAVALSASAAPNIADVAPCLARALPPSPPARGHPTEGHPHP